MIRAVLLCGLLLLPTAASADELSVMTGVGVGVGIFNGIGSDIRQGAFILGAAHEVADNWALVWEAQLLMNDRPHSGQYGGIALSLRRDLPEFWSMHPFVSAGAGLGYLNANLEQSDGFNFVLQSSLGVRLPWKMQAEVRWHHVSNARLRDPNPGINTLLFLVGPRWDW